jgi:hypothetical protein
MKQLIRNNFKNLIIISSIITNYIQNLIAFKKNSLLKNISINVRLTARVTFFGIYRNRISTNN